MLPTRSKKGQRWCDDIVDYTLKHHHHNDNSRCWPENESIHLFLLYTYVNRILVNSVGTKLNCHGNWNGKNMSEQSHVICSAHTTDAQLTVMMAAVAVMHDVYKSFGWHENTWGKNWKACNLACSILTIYFNHWLRTNITIHTDQIRARDVSRTLTSLAQ